MEQLVQPNLSVIGYPDYCLAYVEQVFGVTNDPDPDAWQGWLNAKYKHATIPPAGLSVPVWFSWTGTINGVTQNWGHVAVSTPSGVYTNPLTGSGHNVFQSVQALASAYGVSYVGWSEDISNLRIVEETPMSTVGPVELNDLSLAFFGYAADQNFINAWQGTETNTMIRWFQANSAHTSWVNKVNQALAQNPASYKQVGTINGTAVYEQA